MGGCCALVRSSFSCSSYVCYNNNGDGGGDGDEEEEDDGDDRYTCVNSIYRVWLAKIYTSALSVACLSIRVQLWRRTTGQYYAPTANAVAYLMTANYFTCIDLPTRWHFYLPAHTQHPCVSFVFDYSIRSRRYVHAIQHLIFIARQHTDARYWYSNTVCLSVCPSVCQSVTFRYHGLTYCQIFSPYSSTHNHSSFTFYQHSNIFTKFRRGHTLRGQ